MLQATVASIQDYVVNHGKSNASGEKHILNTEIIVSDSGICFRNMNLAFDSYGNKMAVVKKNVKSQKSFILEDDDEDVEVNNITYINKKSSLPATKKSVVSYDSEDDRFIEDDDNVVEKIVKTNVVGSRAQKVAKAGHLKNVRVSEQTLSHAKKTEKSKKHSSSKDEDNDHPQSKGIELVQCKIYSADDNKKLFDYDPETNFHNSKITPEEAKEFYERFAKYNHEIPMYYNREIMKTPDGRVVQQRLVVKLKEDNASQIQSIFKIDGDERKNGAEAVKHLLNLCDQAVPKKPNAWTRFNVYVDTGDGKPKFVPLKSIFPHGFRTGSRYNIEGKSKANKKGKQDKEDEKTEDDDDEDIEETEKPTVSASAESKVDVAVTSTEIREEPAASTTLNDEDIQMMKCN